MTEETNSNVQDTQDGNNAAAEPKNTEHMIPKSRLDEVLSERNKLRERLAALEQAQQQQREQELTEQNRFKELYEEAQRQIEALSATKDAAERYQQALQATNEARLARIPEDKRGLVPEYDDPVKLGAWLDNAEALLTEPAKPKPPKADGGSGSGSDSKSAALPANIASVADMARELGYAVNEERLAQFIRKPTEPSENTGE